MLLLEALRLRAFRAVPLGSLRRPPLAIRRAFCGLCQRRLAGILAHHLCHQARPELSLRHAVNGISQVRAGYLGAVQLEARI